MRERLRTIRWRWVLGGIGALVLAATIIRGILAPPPNVPTEAERQAATRQVGGGEAHVPEPPPSGWIAGNGIIEPRSREHAIGVDVAGQLVAIFVNEGQRVARGAPMIHLRDDVERAALAAAKAEAEAARARLLLVARGNRREDVAAAVARAAEAEAKARLSEGVYERLRAVGSSGGVTADEIARAKQQAAADRAGAQAAQAERQEVSSGARVEEINQAQAELAAAEARQAQAEADVDMRTVRAPLDGEVLEINFRVGEYYQPGATALLIMGDTNTLRARVEINERFLGEVELDARAIVRSDAFAGRDFHARVVELGDRVRPKEIIQERAAEPSDVRVLPVWVELEDARDLVVGQRVMAYIRRPPGAQSAR